MNPIKKIVLNASAKARKKRADIFRHHFVVNKDTKILDLGSENGTNINNLLQGTDFEKSNVYIADIAENLISEGEKLYGFNGITISENEKLPFEDKFFDIVYCSSVIEHTTIPKSELWEWKSNVKFKDASWERQTEFANEIIRLGKHYFVQTPAKSFPIESHTWLPIVGYLPRELFLPVLKVSNKIWVKKSDPDFNLLNSNEMKKLFPQAEIIKEDKFGLTKSIMAVKTNK